MTQSPLICLTPIKNEAWILHRFLKCASLWADHIIIANQNSTDHSREIALSYPKVILVDNPSPTFNEPERQKLLLNAARKIGDRRILIALDADEILTANFLRSPEWESILNALPGTILRFDWVNLHPDMKSCWVSKDPLHFGFVDDGSEHCGQDIHSPRLPMPSHAPSLLLRDIKVLHYQYTDWERMKSKHRWYQCWERLQYPQRSAIEIYRRYHHMDVINKSTLQPVLDKWLDAYQELGIDMTSVSREGYFYWDKEVLNMISKFGAETFKRENIWQVDWVDYANHLNEQQITSNRYTDPRTPLERWLHKWLARTQNNQHTWLIRAFQGLLSTIGW